MALFKYTMIFELRTNASNTSTISRIGGWSESIYAQSVDFARLTDLCAKRAGLLPISSSIVGQRVQQVDPAGNSSTRGAVFPGNSGKSADVPQMALLVTGNGVGVPNVRRWTLRGLPDNVVNDGEYTPNGTFWQPAIDTYLATISNGFWGFRARNLTDIPTAVESVSATGDVVTAEDFTISVGDEVSLRGVTVLGFGLVSRRCKVINKTGLKAFKVSGWPAAAGVGGTVLNMEDTVFYALAPTPSINRVVVRKVGRPFSGFRGRASART